MTVQDLLERRADRGVPRGAADVWQNVHLQGSAEFVSPKRPSAMIFRAAVFCWILALGAVVVLRPDTDVATLVASDAQEEPAIESDEPFESDEPLPAPLLIDGGTLKRDRGGVSRPFDPNFDGDDIFDRIFPTTDRHLPADGIQESSTTIVFAGQDDPFSGPIVGIEQFDDGGFRPWGVNIPDGDLSDFTKHLEQVDGGWQMGADSDLVEVARFRGDEWDLLKFGWQFDFELAGDDELTIQAETTTSDRQISEWTWIARLADKEQPVTTVRPQAVLGYDGFVIGSADRSDDDGVVWFADEFVYRMTASMLKDNTSTGRDVTTDIELLRVASRAEWVDEIAASTRRSTSDTVGGLLALLIVLSLVVSVIYFMVRRSFGAAALAGATVAAAFFFVAGPAYFGTVPVTAAGLALAWWLYSRSQDAAGLSHANPSPLSEDGA